MDMIYSLEPRGQVIFIRRHEHYEDLEDKGHPIPGAPIFPCTVKDSKEFNRIKFEFVKYLKTLPNPEHRIGDWEWKDEDGHPDFEKLERLIERRKTREEKEQELRDELYLKEQFEKNNIEYKGPLSKL